MVTIKRDRSDTTTASFIGSSFGHDVSYGVSFGHDVSWPYESAAQFSMGVSNGF
ncbi:MAG TPA: hypothetical protein VFG54_19240 [Prolixibacteraceae bacterium]|nr:hypothetical protein [Prolixibacteraceae bacterium]